MAETCRILIFTGDGKGKTTAALGMALRASGHGMQVKIIQFMKADASTGEIAAINNLPGVELVQAGLGFVPQKSSPRFEDHKKAAEAGLELAKRTISSADENSLIVLDEICGAVSLGLLDENEVQSVVRSAENGCIIVMTGRGATQAMIELADTVTEMKPIKHAMNAGIPAQKGIEF